MTNLYLAYAATWIIHIVYIIFLSRKAARLRAEVKELER
ncbi:MAG TPA: CcmD family protein [Longimicrobiales bacterium]|nr:CcmD family protein [Longimicrobiales bacterium]